FDTPEEAQAALPRFYALEGAEVVQGAPDNIELTAKGVDKGTALLALADRLGIPCEATAAFGDSENDRAMLEKAGIAAVMANGMPQIKALADLVSTGDCDHDGVAELFERLGL
ncbi:MAG: HAD hydrolase family protein, partial [Faecalibacterium sp.]|nr:HAD hydrolase family protein [Faecalibacterium sp.]